MPDGQHGCVGSSLLEVLVSVQLVALVLALSWPLHSLVLSATGPSSTWPGSLRAQAARYVQAELEYLRSFGYARFRDPAACATGGPPPFPAVRVLPEDAEPGEPLPPPPLRRSEVRVDDEPVLGAAPRGCGPRRVSVRVYGDDPDRPLARGELLRVLR